MEPKETRYVDGIPIDVFKNEEKRRKLPKGWTYNTKLFHLEQKPNSEDVKLFDSLHVSIDNPDSIKKAYESGLLVKSNQIFHGNIEEDITKDGFCIVKKYPIWQHHVDRVSIRPDKVYFTYKEAKEERDKYIAEFKRQASLSDYEWSVEQIEKTISMWKAYYDATKEEAVKYREWILSMERVEDIETRFYYGSIQWKYEKNKKWNSIIL